MAMVMIMVIMNFSFLSVYSFRWCRVTACPRVLPQPAEKNLSILHHKLGKVDCIRRVPCSHTPHNGSLERTAASMLHSLNSKHGSKQAKKTGHELTSEYLNRNTFEKT